MASDVTTQTGTPATVPAATVIHTDQITATGAHAQLVKLDLGVAGSTSLVSGTVPVSGTVAVSGTVPISGALTDTQLRATPVPVSNANLPLPTGASTAANQATEIASLSSLDTKTPGLGQALAAGSTPVVLTAAQITTLTPPTSVGVNNFPATQAVSAATLPLPTNAAIEAGGNLATIASASALQGTAANQATANTALASVVSFNALAHTELLTAILAELRVHTMLLQSGLNVQDNIDLFRADPSLLN